MSTSCRLLTQVKRNFDTYFDKSAITRLGRQSGFVQRKSRKISPVHFVMGFLLMCCNNRNTYSDWALQVSFLSGKPVSKQGIFERLQQASVTLAHQLLKHTLLQQSAGSYPSRLFAAFKRVLLQDSTTLRLPDSLSRLYPGNHCKGRQRAIARIQCVINIKAMAFLDFTLGSFIQNDISASDAIVALVKKGDLVIRDMGYFVLDVFEQLQSKQAHFLSRLRFGINLYDEQGNRLDWRKLVRKNRWVDQWVYVGGKKRLRVRLVILPVPAQQRAEKIRKAKNDRDKRLNHSKEYYQWLGYSVYITSVSEDVWSPSQVAAAYGVRWQIEIIFKSWKSSFHLQHIFHEGCVHKNRVDVSIYLILLFICLFMQKIYVKNKDAIEKKTDKKISLLKLATRIISHLKEFIALSPPQLTRWIAIYCCYEKRADRLNMTQLYQYE